MSATDDNVAPVPVTDVVERYVTLIGVHLARLAGGHAPLGHLLGIERLARAARAEMSETRRLADRDRDRESR